MLTLKWFLIGSLGMGSTTYGNCLVLLSVTLYERLIKIQYKCWMSRHSIWLQTNLVKELFKFALKSQWT